MNVEERSAAWAVDQLDPDNWLKIPDFGINPGDVAFEGFAFPIVTPNSKNYGLRCIVREHVKTARTLMSMEGRGFSEVSADFREVMKTLDPPEFKDLEFEDLELEPEWEKLEVGRSQAMALFYVIFMENADIIVRHLCDRKPRSLDFCYEVIAKCADGIRELMLLGLKGKKEFSSCETTEALEGYFDPDLVRKIRAEIAKKGAYAKLAKDPKQKEKALVRECWDAWQKRPSNHKDNYKGNSAFALDMLDKFESLENQAVIVRWCVKWTQESKHPASTVDSLLAK